MLEGFCEAAPGSTLLDIVALLTAIGTRPTSRATALGFELSVFLPGLLSPLPSCPLALYTSLLFSLPREARSIFLKNQRFCHLCIMLYI